MNDLILIEFNSHLDLGSRPENTIKEVIEGVL
jgi:hypothetical protein